MPRRGASDEIPPIHFPLAPDATGLFFTSLDAQQTKPDAAVGTKRERVTRTAEDKRIDRLASFYEHYTPPASTTETTFRHGRWQPTRTLVRAALVACHAPVARVERFERCGSDCWVQISECGEKTRLTAHYCGDRFCIPCSEARSRKVRAEIIRLTEGHYLRFVTLTREAKSEPLAKSITHLLDSFTRLRDQKLWRDSVRGSIYFVEITRNESTRRWHCHLHVLVSGNYIPQAGLSDGWRSASGGSYVVDIRAVASNERAASYVAKYATKGFDSTILADADSLIECMLALRGRRLIGSTGCWRSNDVEKPAQEQVKWKTVAKLDDVVRDALTRQPWALGMLRRLRVAMPDEADAPFLRTAPRAPP